MTAPDLPPLTRQYPQWSRTGLLRFDNEIKGTNYHPNIKVKKTSPDVLAASPQTTGSIEAVLRVNQLEQNIRFLQEQHALLLAGLHREIESLKQKNKDLQYQLIVCKKSPQPNEKSLIPCKTTSSEVSCSCSFYDETGDSSDKSPSTSDDAKEKTERPCCKYLEEELTKARAALVASQATAAELQAQLNAYKKKEAEQKSHRIAGSWSTGVVGSSAGTEVMTPREEELKNRLTEAEKLVEGLRAQGERQRREVVEGGVTNLLFDTAPPVARNYLASIKASLNAAGRGNGSGGRSGQNRGGSQQRFPPVQQRENEQVDDSSPVRKQGSLKSCFASFGRLSKSCAKPSDPSNSEYGSWTRSNHRRGGDKNDSPQSPVLPDVRGTNVTSTNYNDGNNGNNSQQGGRGGGYQGYSNQYFRGGGHRNSNPDDSYQKKNSNEDLSDSEVSSSQQQTNYTRPGHSYTNSRYKRGHHSRQHDNL